MITAKILVLSSYLNRWTVHGPRKLAFGWHLAIQYQAAIGKTPNSRQVNYCNSLDLNRLVGFDIFECCEVM